MRRLTETYQDFMKFMPQMATEYAPYPMSTSLVNAIRIHSSLMSNMWEADGRKTDVIEIVPVLENSQKDEPINYEPNSSGSRICNARDTINSLQSFNIYLTDEYDMPLDFTAPYELKLAIFFKKP